MSRVLMLSALRGLADAECRNPWLFGIRILVEFCSSIVYGKRAQERRREFMRVKMWSQKAAITTWHTVHGAMLDAIAKQYYRRNHKWWGIQFKLHFIEVKPHFIISENWNIINYYVYGVVIVH